MALPSTASVERWSHGSPEGELVDLAELRERLEARLLVDERALSRARAEGQQDIAGEAEWVRMLRRYERLCDLLARQGPVLPLPAA